ncbi:MAG: SPASM domain-containing protein [Desulfarculaceae bacterium]|nr:SPASM domain-containing protein [Desulfarculaceae bacterium]MCF8124364.1 SPASM domain-containing protein [Desulfarculaceae bacterium]
MEMKTYKKSSYIHLTKHDGHIYCAQLMSRALLRYPDSFLGLIEQLLEHPEENGNEASHTLKEIFIDNSFLIPAEQDELQLLKKRFEALIRTPEALSLCILPTTECNFACRYCYEHLPPMAMHEEVVAAIIENVEKRARNLRRLDVVWFGGEPTIRMDIVDRISRKLIAICQDNGVEYASSMVSNGSLINRDTAAKLKQAKISKLQVTVDGNPASHDQRRPFKDGRGSYSTIFGNMVAMAEFLEEITLRINVDTQSEDEFGALLDALQPYAGKMVLFPAAVTLDGGEQNHNQSIAIMAQYRRNADRLAQLAMERGWPVYKGMFSSLSHFCQAYYLNNFIVMPDGSLYRCNYVMGSLEHRKGDIRQGFPNYFTEEIGFDPFSNQQCIECKALPLCLGGCLLAGEPGDGNPIRCWLRHNLDRVVVSAGTELLTRRGNHERGYAETA